MAKRNAYTLFEISDDIHDIIAELEHANAIDDVELVEELTDELLETLEKQGKKYESYVHIIKSSEALAEAAKKVAQEFKQKADTHTKLIARLKGTLLEDMLKHETPKAAAGNFQLAIQKNSVPTLKVANPETLPEDYTRVEIVVDTLELRRAIKRGEEIEGVEAETGSHLRIRAR